MKIINYGHFTTSLQGNVFSYTNEAGQDWYEIRRGLTNWTESGEFIDAIYGAWVTVNVDTLLVTNVEYDPSRLVPDNRIVLGIDADWQDIKEGMLFKDGLLVEAPAPTPEELRASMRSLTPREFRDALIDHDIMPDQVTEAISRIADEKAKAKALNAWEYPTQFNRIDPLVGQIASTFGLTPEKVDEMWLEAMVA
ncbi:hypothetical protein [Rhizobium skierniewicense]|uniref:hypothetical protein n=1 Tax=Rhizobium skierniewicense TaxID=984260 RepID=UPI001571B2F7|nr:hypothetical protein [Rhizobium skierniewicense]NTF33892.1 hypothetical protein [Rhizobium skierniewicense]